MTTADPNIETAKPQRVDKWLWRARFFKTRTLASKLCSAGKVRVNRERITKPSHGVRPGDVLTFPQARRIRVVRIVKIGVRRGPAAEARMLFEDLSPEAAPEQPAPEQKVPAERVTRPGERARGAGRPTKAQRRAIDAFLRGR
ncbi:MAG: RNA-binding S4 domain-containing protein [Sphingomonadales bacterium]